MDTQRIKDLGLSTADFDLMIKALDELPRSEKVGEAMTDLFAGMLLHDKPGELSELQRKMSVEKSRRRQELEIMAENIKMLQGKLILLKRMMIEADLMDSVKYPPR